MMMFDKTLFPIKGVFVAIVSVFLVTTFCVKLSLCVKMELHNFMDESELKFYFDSKSKSDAVSEIEYEIVDLKVRAKRSVDRDSNGNSGTRTMEFEAFERPFQLRLEPNEHLISPHLRVYTRTADGATADVFEDGENEIQNCYFIHNDGENVGAFSNCWDEKFSGLMLTSNGTFEILPLNERLSEIIVTEVTKDAVEGSFFSPHLIKEVKSENLTFNDATRKIIRRKSKSMELNLQLNVTNPENLVSTDAQTRLLSNNRANIVIEVGVFFDAAAYEIFAPFLGHDDRKLADVILMYMNAVQAIYHHPSLGVPIDIVIVNIEIMKQQPQSLPTHNGERDSLLDSFCDYQKRLNSPDDNDPNHWDMGLYISGLDFYAYENGFNSGTTMGLATVRGVCTPTYSCVIAEFGTKNAFGKPYPSAGFTSVYILAHEMGHNIGMSHDSTGNHCSKEGYIMSPSRGTNGETTWSSCSAQVAKDLQSWAKCLRDRPVAIPFEYNAWKFRGYPGQAWSAKRQCELLLIDEDATVASSLVASEMCQSLKCKSPHKTGYYFAGPALEGTHCDENKWCEGGKCVKKKELEEFAPIIKGGWSAWKDSKCSSGCISKSKGFRARRRTCDNPKPLNTDEGCDGSSYDVILCNDYKACRQKKRKNIIDFATEKCKEFQRYVPFLDPQGPGLQAPHETLRLWMSCSIFCRRDDGSFYTPRLELNDAGVDPYFPDGTLCHTVGGENFYCLQHHCLPEGFQFTKNALLLLNRDVPIAGNAYPNASRPYNKKLKDYLSLDKNGRPLLTDIRKEDLKNQHTNEIWIDDDDYRVVPRSLLNGID